MADKKKNKKVTPPDLNPSDGSKKPTPKFSFNFYWIYGIIIVAFILINFVNWGGGAKEISYQNFDRDMLQPHDVEKVVVINEKQAEVYIKKDKLKDDRYKDVRTKSIANVDNPGPHYYFNIGSVETFEKKLEEAQKDFPKEDRVQPST